MTPETLYDLLSNNLAANAKKPALIDADRTVDYATLVAEADCVAGHLARCGVEKGDRVVVHLRKSIKEVSAMLGAAKIGAVVVNVNTQWTPTQLLHVIQDSSACAIITEASKAKRLSENGVPPHVVSVLVDGQFATEDARFQPWMTDIAFDVPTATQINPTDLAMIIYTSGSTGLPKGVMLSHRNILVGAASVVEYLRLGPTDRLLSVLPYSFDAGLNQLTTMLLVGGAVVHQPVVMPTEILKTVLAHEVTGVAGVPPIWNQLVRLLKASPTPLPSLRRVTNTGGKIPPDILELMPTAFPDVEIFLMYGLTEAFRSTYLDPAKFAQKMGSIGQAVPNAQVFVIKHGVGRAGPGEEGELVHVGPLVSLGYWNKPDLTAQKIRPCPELADLIGDADVVYSGDTVRVDADGDLWFVGRNDDMIKTSGFRLSPTEVEDLVSSSGLVNEVIAFGVPDTDLGQVVHIAVSVDTGFQETALLAHCRKTMPNYMVPRRINEFTSPFPRTASGKLDRVAVIGAIHANISRRQDSPMPSLQNGV